MPWKQQVTNHKYFTTVNGINNKQGFCKLYRFIKDKSMVTMLVFTFVLCFWKKMFRSSCSQIFFKISVLKNFANFTGEHVCWSLFLIKLQPNFVKKRHQHR